MADTLKAQFAHNQIFRDIETIEPGVDFVEAIERALGSCVVLLAVIGPRWLSATDKSGRRRLDDPNDYTRIEIAAALQRKVRVIPVLVDGAAMPDAEELPDDLQTLARRQASELSDKRWDFDVRQLVLTIEKVPGIQKRSDAPQDALAAPSTPVKAGLWAGVAAAAMIGITFIWWRAGEEPKSSPDTLPSEAPVISRAAPAPNDSSGSDVVTPNRAADAPAAADPSSQPAKVPPPTSKREAPSTAPVAAEQVPERPKYTQHQRRLDRHLWQQLRSDPQREDRVADIRMLPNSLGRAAEGNGTLSGRDIALDYYAFVDPQLGASEGRAMVEVSADGRVIQGVYEARNGVRLPFLLRR